MRLRQQTRPGGAQIGAQGPLGGAGLPFDGKTILTKVHSTTLPPPPESRNPTRRPDVRAATARSLFQRRGVQPATQRSDCQAKTLRAEHPGKNIQPRLCLPGVFTKTPHLHNIKPVWQLTEIKHFSKQTNQKCLPAASDARAKGAPMPRGTEKCISSPINANSKYCQQILIKHAIGPDCAPTLCEIRYIKNNTFVQTSHLCLRSFNGLYPTCVLHNL